MNIIKTILSWQPWKVAVTAVSSVAVVSGAATGVGVTIANNVNEQEPESAYVSESNQDTPVLAPVESGTEMETETESQTQPSTQAPPSTTTTEPTTQEKITWTYDEKLSRELFDVINSYRKAKQLHAYSYDNSLLEQAKVNLQTLPNREDLCEANFIVHHFDRKPSADDIFNIWVTDKPMDILSSNIHTASIAVAFSSNGYYSAWFAS